MHTLALTEQPVGFDVCTFTGSEELPYRIGDQVSENTWIRVKRQPDFTGSAILKYLVDGKEEAVQETGSADLRDDTLVGLLDDRPAPADGEPPLSPMPAWRLQTNTECLPKS